MIVLTESSSISAFTRDTRTTTKMKNATKQLVDALEATRDMAKSHFGGDE